MLLAFSFVPSALIGGPIGIPIVGALLVISTSLLVAGFALISGDLETCGIAMSVAVGTLAWLVGYFVKFPELVNFVSGTILANIVGGKLGSEICK